MRRAGAGYLASVVILGLVTGCASAPPQSAAPAAPAVAAPAPAAADTPDLAATYRKLAQGGGQVFALDAAASSVRIYVFRGGAAAAHGHNHILTAPRFSGYAYLPAQGFDKARFDLQFSLNDLVVDDPELRKATGGAFDTALTKDDIEGTRQHMLGDGALDVAHFPDLRVSSVAIVGEAPLLAARIRIRLHGVDREQDVPLNLSLTGDHFEARGALVLKQSDYGIKPYSVLGGLLSVRDEIVIAFKLNGSRAG